MKLTYMKPELIELTGLDTFGFCTNNGSGDAVFCTNGNNAGNTCSSNGNIAAGLCTVNGMSAGVDCSAGSGVM